MQNSITLSIGLISHESIRNFSNIELRILDELLFLIGKQQDPNEIKQKLCMPGLKYLAEKAKCSYWTASRAISKLFRAGIIWKRQRGKRIGNYKTNIYQLGSKIISAVKQQVAVKVGPILSRLRGNASISKPFNKGGSNKEGIIDLINRIGRKFGFNDISELPED